MVGGGDPTLRVGWPNPILSSGDSCEWPARSDRITDVNNKESEIDMPEPQEDQVTDFPNSSTTYGIDFARMLCRNIVASRIACEGRHGRLIHVESSSTRRTIRRYASARASVTEADALFVALAYLPVEPVNTIISSEESAHPIHRMRLVRTLGDRAEYERWAIIQAARLMSAVDQTARSCGASADWILEGVEWNRISETLAVPADHRICGMIAVSLAGVRISGESFSELGPVPIDHNGFGGGYVSREPNSGEAPERAL